MVNQNVRAQIAEKRDALVAACERNGVARLDLFGSAVTGAWRPGESDLDFLVTFHPGEQSGLADRYLALAESLEALFERPVDLLLDRTIRNPYLRHSVDATRVPVYGE